VAFGELFVATLVVSLNCGIEDGYLVEHPALISSRQSRTFGSASSLRKEIDSSIACGDPRCRRVRTEPLGRPLSLRTLDIRSFAQRYMGCGIEHKLNPRAYLIS
jgi:hypothetical protein